MVGARLRGSLLRWFDNTTIEPRDLRDRRIDWLRAVPFIGMHLACLGVIWVGRSPFAVVTAIVLYVVSMLAITGFYHRYFTHRSFQAPRATQFATAVLGASAVQRGPLWWAAHHRHHHVHSDRPQDSHSPHQDGFWWSHVGWNLRTVLAARREANRIEERRR